MYLSTREREAGKGEVQNRSWLLSEFKDSLGYIHKVYGSLTKIRIDPHVYTGVLC